MSPMSPMSHGLLVRAGVYLARGLQFNPKSQLFPKYFSTKKNFFGVSAVGWK